MTFRVEYEKSGEVIVDAPDLKTLALYILSMQQQDRADKVKRVWQECKQRMEDTLR